MSFVLLVINDAAPNSLNSFVEKFITFLNTLSLKTLPKLAATLEDNSIITIADSILISAIPSI